MILTDTGPLVALIDRKDPNHAACVEAMRYLPASPLATTWPCFTEAMYLLHRAGGYPAQNALWRLLHGGRLILHELNADARDRMEVLMGKYCDQPMDLADASIIAAAEHIETPQVFSLDADFRIYRLSNGSTLDIVP